MISHASNYTNVAASQTAQKVLTGGTVKVMGIVAENAGGASGRVQIFEQDGTTLIVALSVPQGDSKQISIPFIAERGVAVTTPANITCTVFHTQVL